MTDLLLRVRRLGLPVIVIAAPSKLTRGAFSNAMYGRRRLSPAASARVEAVLRRFEAEHAALVDDLVTVKLIRAVREARVAGGVR